MNRWMIILGCLVVVVAVVSVVLRSRNAAVVEELRAEPDGERAKKVMALTLPSGRTIPVNYLREGDTVYAGADFPWWRELRPDGGRGSVLIQGETLPGYIRAIEDDPERRTEVFARLRPNAVPWWGVLVVVELDAGDEP